MNMKSFQVFLAENAFLTQYTDADTLSKQTSDPENDPYRSKYLAREKLSELKRLISDFREDNSDIDAICVEAAINFSLGVYFLR